VTSADIFSLGRGDFPIYIPCVDNLQFLPDISSVADRQRFDANPHPHLDSIWMPIRSFYSLRVHLGETLSVICCVLNVFRISTVL
jgi:hypothetical protein